MLAPCLGFCVFMIFGEYETAAETTAASGKAKALPKGAKVLEQSKKKAADNSKKNKKE